MSNVYDPNLTPTSRQMAADKPLVLVTGASGLIGGKLVRALADDYRVLGLDIKPPDDFSGEAFVECDLTDDGDTLGALRQVAERHGRQIASVVHLAAYYDFAGEPSPMYEELTVQGTRRLLEGLRPLEVEQFVFSSSLLVMHPSEDGQPLTEDSPTQAEWDYPESKVKTEALIHKEHGEIPAVVVRLAGAYDEWGHSPPITQQMRRIYEKDFESYFFPGNDQRGPAYIHLDDAVSCLVAVVEARESLGPYEVFLAGEEDVVSYEELQEIIGKECHGKEWPSIRIPKALAKVGAWVQNQIGNEEEQFIKPWMIDLADAHYPVSTARLREKTGWRPKHHLRNTLPEMVRIMKRDPQRWYAENGLPGPE